MATQCSIQTQGGWKRLRPAVSGDWRGINALHRWAWFPERSEAGWRWMFGLAGGTAGWVLEDDGGVCGFLGNLVQSYSGAGAVARAATGYSLIVSPRARGGSRALLEAFRQQPDVFAASIFNGNSRSAEVYPREGFSGFPPGWSDAKIVWPLRPFTIAAERVAWKVLAGKPHVPELFGSDGARGSGISLRDRRIVQLHPARDARALGAYWDALRATGGLLAIGSAEVMLERFSDPDRTSDPILLGWLDGNELIAVAMAQIGKMSELEAPILDIIDLTWLRASSISAPVGLISQMKEIALDRRASRMRLPLANSSLASVAREVAGAVIRRRHVHAHVSLRDPALGQAWSPTPFDGDFGFSLRPPPVAGGRRPDISNDGSRPRAIGA